jgi:hypothetical protein
MIRMVRFRFKEAVSYQKRLQKFSRQNVLRRFGDECCDDGQKLFDVVARVIHRFAERLKQIGGQREVHPEKKENFLLISKA